MGDLIGLDHVLAVLDGLRTSCARSATAPRRCCAGWRRGALGRWPATASTNGTDRAAAPSRLHGPPAFQRLLDEQRDVVWRYLVASVGRDEADDCFQETFLSAMRAYPRLRRRRTCAPGC